MNPWNYFALNSRQFNRKKGIISKLDMDDLIPESMRLDQYYYDPDVLPARYPVFLKPEWGQNSRGIVRIPGEKSYRKFARNALDSKIPYIVQEAGQGKREFEIYYLRKPENSGNYALLSVTEVLNSCEPYHPINSIHNPCTRYREISPELKFNQLRMIWRHLKDIGAFPMARVCVKADDTASLTRAEFKIVEINLFLPMPLVLFTENAGWFKKLGIAGNAMALAARLAKQTAADQSGRQIFLQKLPNL